MASWDARCFWLAEIFSSIMRAARSIARGFFTFILCDIGPDVSMACARHVPGLGPRAGRGTFW